MVEAAPRPAPLPRRREPAIFIAFAAFVIANLIHNRFGLDPALAPAALLVAFYARRPARGLLLGAAIFIALPSFLFLDVRVLLDPADRLRFCNHLALLVAGAFAVLGAARDLIGSRRAPRAS